MLSTPLPTIIALCAAVHSSFRRRSTTSQHTAHVSDVHLLPTLPSITMCAETSFFQLFLMPVSGRRAAITTPGQLSDSPSSIAAHRALAGEGACTPLPSVTPTIQALPSQGLLESHSISLILTPRDAVVSLIETTRRRPVAFLSPRSIYSVYSGTLRPSLHP